MKNADLSAHSMNGHQNQVNIHDYATPSYTLNDRQGNLQTINTIAPGLAYQPREIKVQEEVTSSTDDPILLQEETKNQTGMARTFPERYFMPLA